MLKKKTMIFTVLVTVSLIINLLLICVTGYQHQKIQQYQPETLLAIPENATYSENQGIISDKYKIFAIYRNVPSDEIVYEFYNSQSLISYGVCEEKELGIVELQEKETGKRWGYAILQGDRFSLMTEEGVMTLYRGKEDIALISGKVPE